MSHRCRVCSDHILSVGAIHWECLRLAVCGCGLPSVSVAGPGECDSAVYSQLVIMFMIVTFTAILRRGSKFVLSITAYLLYLAFVLVEDLLTARDKNSLSSRKPKKTVLTFQTILTPSINLVLNNDHTIYAICPKRKCHCTYKSIISHGPSAPEYPMHCTFSGV